MRNPTVAVDEFKVWTLDPSVYPDLLTRTPLAKYPSGAHECIWMNVRIWKMIMKTLLLLFVPNFLRCLKNCTFFCDRWAILLPISTAHLIVSTAIGQCCFKLLKRRIYFLYFIQLKPNLPTSTNVCVLVCMFTRVYRYNKKLRYREEHSASVMLTWCTLWHLSGRQYNVQINS